MHASGAWLEGESLPSIPPHGSHLFSARARWDVLREERIYSWTCDSLWVWVMNMLCKLWLDVTETTKTQPSIYIHYLRESRRECEASSWDRKCCARDPDVDVKMKGEIPRLYFRGGESAQSENLMRETWYQKHEAPKCRTLGFLCVCVFVCVLVSFRPDGTWCCWGGAGGRLIWGYVFLLCF